MPESFGPRPEEFSFKSQETSPEKKVETPEMIGEKFDLNFYVTDHSPDHENTGNREALHALYKDIQQDGITSVRYDWRWKRIEPKNQKFNEESTGRYRDAIEIMHEEGLQPPTLVLSEIPTWAMELYKTDKEKFFAEFRSYVEHVKKNLEESTQKTGQLVERVQILNELNNTVYTPIDSKDVPRLCEITRDVLFEYNPDIKLLGTVFAGNLPEMVKKATFGKVTLGTPIEEYLETHADVLKQFDVIAVDYYPGMWHIPLGEAKKNNKEIFQQLGLLEETMKTIAGWGIEYELGEVGIQTNRNFMSGKNNREWGEEYELRDVDMPTRTGFRLDKHNQDRQRYFYNVFFREFKHMLLNFQEQGIPLPKSVGLYQAMDETPRNLLGKILRKLTPFPEHDMGMRKGDLSRKEILRGNRKTGEGPSRLSKIIDYMRAPMRKNKKEE